MIRAYGVIGILEFILEPSTEGVVLGGRGVALAVISLLFEVLLVSSTRRRNWVLFIVRV